MNHDPRPHIHRRGNAIGRLRSLTTGAALAAVAGTAGFGLLAAVSWSGSATAADATGDSASTIDGAGGSSIDNGTNGSNGSNGTSGSTGTSRTKIAPNAAGSTPQPAATPRVQRGSGSGHASTGGSH